MSKQASSKEHAHTYRSLVMPRRATPCAPRLRTVRTPRNATQPLSHATQPLSHATQPLPIPRHATPRHATPRHATYLYVRGTCDPKPGRTPRNTS